MNIITPIRNRLQGFSRAYRRFPLTILLAVGLFVWLIVNEYRMDQILSQVWVGRLISTWIYAIILAFLIGSLSEGKSYTRLRMGLIYAIGAAIVAVVYFWVFPGDQRLFVQDGVYVYFGLILATLLAIFLESSLRPGQRVPHKALEVLTSFAWTALFSFVIGLGSFLVFVMIDALFDANLRLDRFARVIFEATMLLFAVPFFLSGLKPSGQTIEKAYQPLFQRLLRFVCLPLAFVYTAVLYVYFAKILITQTWPQGLVSHLVLWYSLFVIAVYIFLRGDKDKLPKVIDYFPLALLPLLAMMFGSIGQRIAQYGWTPNRYLVVLAGIWSLGALIYISLKKYSPWILAASLVLVILIGTNSPLGAYDVSVRSQKQILNDVLVENQMLLDDQLVSVEVDPTVRQRISASVLWFVNQQATNQLAFLPEDYVMNDFETVFGFMPDYQDVWGDRPQYVGFYAQQDFSLETQAGKLLYVAMYGNEPKTVEGFTFRIEGEYLMIETDTQELSVSFSWLVEQASENKLQEMRLLEEGGYQIYIQNASGRLSGDDVQLNDVTFYLIAPNN